MTIAERLELAGIEKGRQEEREKALEKTLEAARRMQKMGMSSREYSGDPAAF